MKTIKFKRKAASKEFLRENVVLKIGEKHLILGRAPNIPAAEAAVAAISAMHKYTGQCVMEKAKPDKDITVKLITDTVVPYLKTLTHEECNKALRFITEAVNRYHRHLRDEFTQIKK